MKTNSKNQGVLQERLIDLRKAYFYIFIGILCLGTGPIFVKFIRATGSLVGFYRLLFAAIILTIPTLHQKKKISNSASTTTVKWAVLGGIAFAINISLWNTALTMTTASKVTLLDNTAPIWVGLFGWFLLGKREGWIYWVGLLITFIGAGLMINIGQFQINSQQGFGDLLGILSGFAYAIYLLLTNKARSQMDSLTYTWVLAFAGSFTLFLVNLFLGHFSETISITNFMLILAMAVSSQVFGWFLINYALGVLPVAIASVILLGQPVVTTVLGIMIIGEVPTLMQTVGGLLCLSGIFIVQKSNAQ